MKQQTIFVGLSGGVDSSLSAHRLVNAGHKVVGVFIKVWQPDFLVCDWERERLDAMRVAAHLNIPFLTFDAETIYKQAVADYMIREYAAGRTPNPDVMCNQHVKFGAFLDFARAEGAHKVATGHYARVKETPAGYQLQRGVDTQKDQSYFLWTLTQAQLADVIFPIGDTTKAAVRKEAEQAGLPTFAKQDSQGICFLGHVDMKEFLGHYVTTEPGNVLDEMGEVIGRHDGALYYTLGQRHGFTIAIRGTQTEPHYVVEKNIEKNTITVARSPRTLSRDTFTLTHCNEIGRGFQPLMHAQFRYRQTPFYVTCARNGESDHAILVAQNPEQVETPAPGQSCVLYDGDDCLGGGIIDERTRISHITQ